MGVFEVIGIGSIMPFISVASNPDNVIENPYLNLAYTFFRFESVEGFLFFLGSLVVILLLVSNSLRTVVTYLLKRYSAMRFHSLSLRLLRRYISQPYVYFLNQNSSDLLKNILGEVGVVINKVLVPTLEMATNIIICLFIVGLLVIVNPLLALLMSIVLSITYILIYMFVRKKLKELGSQRVEANRKRYKHTSEVLGGIKDVKLLGRESVFLDHFKEPSKRFVLNDAYSNVIAVVPRYALETIVFGGILLIVLYLMKVQGDFSNIIPIVSLYAFAGYRLMPAMQKIFRGITKLKYNLPIVDLLYNELNGLKEYPLPDRIMSINSLPIEKEIQLKDIEFTYPKSRERVIKKQSLTVKANTTVGLVGPTGCGKTTIVDVILGLLEPQSGELIIDGTKIKSNNLRNWQANIGYVPQSIFLIDDTVAKNIAFGVPDKEIDYEAIKKAASIANLDGFIENELDDGYDTLVGERGIRLSGGQRQRIGIARAVYHNPAVIILDEATSALDGLTEKAIMDAIHNLSHKKTIIMIAHRLTTVKECDIIHILDKGIIVDSGNFDDLVQRNERFRQMAEGI